MNQDLLRIEELERELEEKRKEIEELQSENDSLNNSIRTLNEENYQFQDLFYYSPSLLAIFKGENHTIDIANDAMKKVWGKGSDIIGRPLIEVLPELENQGIIELLDQVYHTGESYHDDELPVELVINGKPKLRYFDFTYQAQRNSKGEIVGVANLANDVTKQAILNKKIKKSERDFRELINFMPHKISLSDVEGNPIFYNQNWLDYVGKSSEAFINQPILEIIHPEEKDRVSNEVAKCLSEGCDFDLEVRILDKDGNYHWHLTKATPIRDEEGNITFWISSSTEIQKLKEDEKRKEDFLKLVSHELKTPVTSIKGYVQLLLAILPSDNDESEKRFPLKPYLNRIETQVERLIRLLSEMLDISRIEQNELELKNELFNLNKHVEEIVEDLSYTNNNININLEHKLDCNVVADRDRIGQVIINFITNAIKYSPDCDRVEITIYEYQDKEVAVSVKDFGIGIEKKDQQQIFKKFYRVSGNNDDTYEGFGIGLYLSSEIIEKHNGKIFIKSDVGEGSEFIFTIPLNQIE